MHGMAAASCVIQPITVLPIVDNASVGKWAGVIVGVTVVILESAVGTCNAGRVQCRKIKTCTHVRRTVKEIGATAVAACIESVAHGPHVERVGNIGLQTAYHDGFCRCNHLSARPPCKSSLTVFHYVCNLR